MTDPNVPPLGTLVYRSHAGGPGAETIEERVSAERFWSTLGRKIQAGAQIPAGYDTIRNPRRRNNR